VWAPPPHRWCSLLDEDGAAACRAGCKTDMRLPRSRPHVGKVPMKFYFRAQDVTVDLRDTDIEGTLTLVWKRGYRRTSTEPFAIKEVRTASPRPECHAQPSHQCTGKRASGYLPLAETFALLLHPSARKRSPVYSGALGHRRVAVSVGEHVARPGPDLHHVQVVQIRHLRV
jgi:hypothetical protein